MGKLLASMDKKKMQDRPELIALVKDLQSKEAAYEALKAKKEIAKAELKDATKALRKAMKKKPAKQAAAPKPAKTATAKKTDTAKAAKATADKVVKKTSKNSVKADTAKAAKATADKVVKKTAKKSVAA